MAVHRGYIVALVVVSSALFTGTVMALVPSKFVPFIARAVAKAVAVEALPAKLVAVRVAVEGLKDNFEDDTF